MASKKTSSTSYKHSNEKEHVPHFQTGWMFKRSNDFFKNWKYRFFVLTPDGQLFYFAKEINVAKWIDNRPPADVLAKGSLDL